MKTKENKNYFSVETEHFFFDVYAAWRGSDRKQSMFRAGSYVKINDRRYVLNYALFAEWDYRDKQTAFEAAKQWVLDQILELSKELEIPAQEG